MNTTARRLLVLTSVCVTAALAFSGCATSGTTTPATKDGPVSQADIDKAMKTPTTLTMWSWLPDLQDEIDLFEAKYPAIKVKLVNTSNGTTQYPKLRSALTAGKGAPDVAHIEYAFLPGFRQTGGLADLTPYGAADLKDQFVPWVWGQVSTKDGIWAVPQDSGPMGTLYREDLFTAAGIKDVPATWDEFATTAKTYHEKTGQYLTNIPGDASDQMLGLFWQAGAKPFTFDGDKTVSIDLDSAAAKKVMGYWQDLIKSGAVSTDAGWNDNWYQGLAKGKYGTWLTAAWAPVFLSGTVKDTAGKWRAAELPQWKAGEHASGNWGGSSTAVIATSEHKIAAYELAKFLNTDSESTAMLTSKQSLFPTTTHALTAPAFADQKVDFFGGQQVNKVFADISATVDPDFTWPPFMEYVASSYTETVGDAIVNGGDMVGALTKWDQAVETYAKQQGFTVK
ncbi:ABC transporter substrate-binding protein [Microbacterium gorillae]|uniref:ABC transporter substrate-binding protein n=1 Tax=Microbacterium gorillae TaxID=1231063 RepID=UPI00058BCD60|nr:sugar ABC transporter substrate-binding protein [Microbacterium gorillae]